jgi:diguanylate cyclase (GGDEF)-like protein
MKPAGFGDLDLGLEDIAQQALPQSAGRPGVIYRSERTIVARFTDAADGKSVIRKTFLGPDAAARLRHEARMLERLRDVPGVSRLLSVGPGTFLVLQDTGGVSLAGQAPLQPATVLELARRLAQTLAGIHRRGVLHLDISPANILCGGRDGVPQLIDFHLATFAEEGRRGFTHHNEIAGTLAYIAPELTGRLGQGVDHRADLYALGATLYELAAGEPPFGRGDPLRLLRDVIAASPAPLVGVWSLLSDIILRLLEKEPDRRYQSADGLADDLERLEAAAALEEAPAFPLGASDFPLRLLAPSRLIARDEEIASLRAAFEAAQQGSCSLLLIGGAAGSGKTALIDQFRPIVTQRGGWFVTGSFEPNRRHGAADPLRQVMRRIAALLLAEPDGALAQVRERLQARLGADVALLAAVNPEIAAIFGGAAGVPEDGVNSRGDLASLAFLRAVVSDTRPLVMAFDNLQWASPTALKRIEGLLASDPLPGLLVVGAYRDGETDERFWLSARLARWQRLAVSPRTMTVRNLPPAALTEMAGDMLRLAPDAARDLADVLGARTGGNPADTLDLLNGLRRDGILLRAATGWRWDGAEIRRYVGDAELSERLAARLAVLPAAAQSALADMACLGNHLAPDLLAAAIGTTQDGLDAVLAPALADGLLILEQGALHTRPVLKFRNEAVLRAIFEMIEAQGEAERDGRHLALARRLAAAPAHEQAAAEQFLAALPAIQRPEDASRAAGLFTAAGRAAAPTQRHDEAEAYYAAAIILAERLPVPDPKELTRLRTARLTALYSLGRHDEADQLFAAILGSDNEPLALAEATCVEVLSLCNRGRHADAMAIGLAMLERLGIRKPDGDLEAEVTRGLAALPGWLAIEAVTPLPFRIVTKDRLIRAAARLINRLLPPAQLLDPLTGAWLAVESHRLWLQHGVCPEVVASLARSAAAPNVFGADYRTGYDMARHAVDIGAAYGYEPETSLARQNFATFAVHWFETLETTAEQAAAANAGLVEAGEVQAACINYISSLAALFDCAPTLEVYGGELTKARDFTARTGNDQLFESFHAHFRLLQMLTGAADAAAGLARTKDPALEGKYLATFGFHCSQAILSALFDDPAGLAAHSAAAMPLLPRIGGAYRCAVASLLRAVSIMWDIRAGAAGTPALAEEFAALRGWFVARARDAPANYEHLLHFIDAQAYWTHGDIADAAGAFDRALHACSRHSRPWHFGFIAEQAGLFHLAQGFDYAGRALLADARNRYAGWGATALVRRLTASHGFLDGTDERYPAPLNATSRLSADAMDMLGILRTSQALSSQTNIGALRALVVETLAEMTAATGVTLVLRDEEGDMWRLPPEGDKPGEPIESAAARGALPLFALRYAERTHEPLVVDDARLDDRFAKDPYFADLRRCSLLVMPVQSQGKTRAMLLLENRLKSGVFSQTRLNLVALIAGQLAVSLDNALLYASLERRVAERTEALAAANQQLEALSLSDGLTGLSNRRRFDSVLESEGRRAERAGTGLALVMIDIDHFKRYNDHYGHVRGDHCLHNVATALKSCIRQDVDLVARYGGEEFAIILPGADLTFAKNVAERVRAAVTALAEPHAASPFGQVTISLGIAALNPGPAEPGRLVEFADSALYSAKQAGRNRVVG